MSVFLYEPGTFFSRWIGRQWREQDIHVTLFEQKLGSCWLWDLAQEKRSSASDAVAVCRLFLTSTKRSHRNYYVVPELKPQSTTPREGNSAFTEADVMCKDATVISGRRKRIIPIWTWSRALGHTMSKLVFGECISLLMTRLHWSDCVPIWSTQMCQRFTLELAHVIFVSFFFVGGKIAGWVG